MANAPDPINYFDPDAMTVLLSTVGFRCGKVWKKDAEGKPHAEPIGFGTFWFPTPMHAPSIERMHAILSGLSGATTRCVIRAALVLGTDIEHGVRRKRTGEKAPFIDTPRRWMALDVDKYAGTLAQFMADLVKRFPIFEGVSYVLQRSSSFGMYPSKTSVRLWYRLSLPTTGAFWAKYLDGAPSTMVDMHMFDPIHVHYTAAPSFLDGIDDPCAERFTLVEDMFPEIDVSGYSGDVRLAVLTDREGEVVVDLPTEVCEQDIVNAIDCINKEVTSGTGHAHAAGIAGQLIAYGCPFERAKPVMVSAVARAHGRVATDKELTDLWREMAKKFTKGELKVTRPPSHLAFKDEPPEATPEAAAELEKELACDSEGEWTNNPHVNATRFFKHSLRGFIHWNATDYELLPQGNWRAMETDTTLDMRVSRLSRMKRSKAGEAAFAIRAQYQKEFLNPPCLLSTGKRLDNVILCQNGFMRVEELMRGEKILHPHDPNHFSNSVLDVPYNPDAKCPRFDQFLREVFPKDEATQALMLRIMAYLLVPDTKLQKFFMFVGVPASGKSTLAKVVDAIVGQENTASITDMSDLLGPFGLQPVLGKHVIYLPEANVLDYGHQAKQITNMIKKITGEDFVTVNRKNRPQLRVKLPGRVIITCNQAPSLGDETGALDRRLVVAKFNVSFQDHPEIGLDDVLISEKEGILNRLLDAIPGVYGHSATDGFHTPDSAKDEKVAILRDASPMGALISDCIEKAFDGRILASDLAIVAARWSASNHNHAISPVSLGRALLRKYGATRFSTGEARGYAGVRLSAEGLKVLAGTL